MFLLAINTFSSLVKLNLFSIKTSYYPFTFLYFIQKVRAFALFRGSNFSALWDSCDSLIPFITRYFHTWEHPRQLGNLENSYVKSYVILQRKKSNNLPYYLFGVNTIFPPTLSQSIILNNFILSLPIYDKKSL